MPAPYTDITFTNAREGGITAQKLNKLRDDLSTAIGGGGTGTGDMTKAVYDANNNGKVDTCDSVPWGSVTGTPATFAPSPHQASHVSGTDQIPSAGTSVRGLMPQANGNANAFYSSDGTQKQVAYTMLSGSQPGPVAHAASHLDNGIDSIPVASTTRTGLAPVRSGSATTYLNGAGAYTTPSGSGDMLKSVYDTNSDNIVDHAALADASPWTGITGKPATFPPDSTAMVKSVYDTNSNNVVDTCDSLAWAKLTGVPATFPPDSTAMLKSVYDTNLNGKVDGAETADVVPWTGITGKPATFPPDSSAMLKSVYDTNGDGVSDHAALADTAPWTGITGKPATFPPGAHAASHLDNGTDVIPVATTSRTGSLRVLNGTATTFLDGTGNWSTPAPGGTVNPGTWTNLTYSTGWTQNTTAQYRVETNGSFQKVICQGIINYASGAASLAFTLPAGAQPGATRGCVLAGFDSSGDVLLFSANVSVAGAVTILPMVRQSFVWPSATNGSVYLDNLTFAL